MAEESLLSAGMHEDGSLLDGLCFALPIEMTIEVVDAVASELRKLISNGAMNLTLDAAQVENITTPGLQLIASLKKTLAARGGNLVIDNKRDSFIRAFSDAGLEGLLK